MDDTWDDGAVPNLSGQLAPIDFRQRSRGGYSDVYHSSWRGILVSAFGVICGDV
jgi:hypothetical protein